MFTTHDDTAPHEPAVSRSAVSSVSPLKLLRGAGIAYQAGQQATPEPPPSGLIERTDRTMGVINGWIAAAFFFDLIFWSDAQQLYQVAKTLGLNRSEKLDRYRWKTDDKHRGD